MRWPSRWKASGWRPPRHRPASASPRYGRSLTSSARGTGAAGGWPTRWPPFEKRSGPRYVETMPVSLAFSPCPNDTFVFHALVHGLVPGAPEVTVTYADVDVTNTAAERGAYDLVKVSYGALPWLLDRYALLPCGGALGRGCGPLVLTRDAPV